MFLVVMGLNMTIDVRIKLKEPLVDRYMQGILGLRVEQAVHVL